MVSSGVRWVLVSALLIPVGASAGEMCVNVGSQPVVQSPAGTPARVYFRSDVAKADHYVEMRAAGSSSWAVLPRIGDGTKFVEYRVVTGSGKAEKVVDSGRINVGETCSAPKLTENQRVAASGLIVGATAEGPAVPAGFRCDGVVGQINAKGELRSYKPCQQVALQQASAAATSVDPSVTKPANSTKSGGKTPISADATLTPGTMRTFAPTRKGPGSVKTPPTPRTNDPYSRSRP